MDKIIYQKIKWNLLNFVPENGLKFESDPYKVFHGHNKINLKLQFMIEDDLMKFSFDICRAIIGYNYKARFSVFDDLELQNAMITHDGVKTMSNGLELEDIKEWVQNRALTISVEFSSCPFIPSFITPTNLKSFDYPPNLDTSLIPMILEFNVKGSIGEVCDINILIRLLEMERHFPNASLKHQIIINLNNALEVSTAPKIYKIANNYGLDELKANAMEKIVSNLTEVMKAIPPPLFCQDLILHAHKSSVPINSNLPPIISVASTSRTQHNRSTQTHTRIKRRTINRLHHWGKIIIVFLIFYNLVHLFFQILSFYR